MHPLSKSTSWKNSHFSIQKTFYRKKGICPYIWKHCWDGVCVHKAGKPFLRTKHRRVVWNLTESHWKVTTWTKNFVAKQPGRVSLSRLIHNPLRYRKAPSHLVNSSPVTQDGALEMASFWHEGLRLPWVACGASRRWWSDDQTPGGLIKKASGCCCRWSVLSKASCFQAAVVSLSLSRHRTDRFVKLLGNERRRRPAVSVDGRPYSPPIVSRFLGKHTQERSRRRRRAAATDIDVRFVSRENSPSVVVRPVHRSYMSQRRVTVTELAKDCAMVGA